MANVDVNRLRSGGWNRPLLTSRYLQQKIQRAARRHECRPTNQRECHYPGNNLRTSLDLQAPPSTKQQRFQISYVPPAIFFSFVIRVELEQMAGQWPCVSLSCVILPKGSGTTHPSYSRRRASSEAISRGLPFAGGDLGPPRLRWPLGCWEMCRTKFPSPAEG